MKKYLITALIVMAGLIAVTALCLTAGFLPEWEIMAITGIVAYTITIRGWFIDPEEIKNFWKARSGK